MSSDSRWKPAKEMWNDYFRQENKDLHVMPNDDKHASSKDCFCHPELTYRDDKTGKGVWVHKGPEELCQ